MIVLVLRQKRNSDLAFWVGAGIADDSVTTPVPSAMDLRTSRLVLMVGVYWLLVIELLVSCSRSAVSMIHPIHLKHEVGLRATAKGLDFLLNLANRGSEAPIISD